MLCSVAARLCHHHPHPLASSLILASRELARTPLVRMFLYHVITCASFSVGGLAVFLHFVVDETITVGSDRYYNPSLALLCHHSFSVG